MPTTIAVRRTPYASQHLIDEVNYAEADFTKQLAHTPACHAAPATTKTVRPVRVDSWLMDSGSPLDLIDRRALRRSHRKLIRPSDPLVLDTANGQVTADKTIKLGLSSLGVEISPLVLDSTPNVLSLGRRVVDEGYDWVWRGGRLDCTLHHPTTGKHFDLRVEEYSPYLDEDGNTMPIADDDAEPTTTTTHTIASSKKWTGIVNHIRIGVAISLTS